jgi:signal transduction histidine kinase
VVAGAGLAGYAWLAGAQSMLAEPLALLLAVYAAGARGISRRQLGQLGALAAYGIAACALAGVATGPFSVSTVAVHALPIVVGPAVAGFLVARQRALAGRLAAATERLRAGEQARLAVVRIRERNRVARELHDVVAHGVSVMVVQAGVARITVADEPDLARAALGEVTGAGHAALAELRRILGIMDAADHAAGPPSGVAGNGTGRGSR